MTGRKTVLKLTLLNLCDMLSNDQIEETIAKAEDLLDDPENYGIKQEAEA